MIRVTLLLIACAFTGATYAQNLSAPPSGNNQKSSVTQYIGSLVHVTVDYNSPDVTSPSGDDRTGNIWGQLVPYGLTDLGFGLRNPSPWRAGANENTTITFSHDVEINGSELDAGTYGLHLIVEEEDTWTWIFSNNTMAWGSYFYVDSEDALRVETKVSDSEFHEWLTYEFTDRQATSAELSLFWEYKQVPMTISVPDMNEIYYTTFAGELQGSAGFNYLNWVSASSYLTNNDYRLEKALEWANSAISAPFVGVADWNTLSNKANVLMKMDNMADAKITIEQAMELPSTTAFQVHGFGRQLISNGYPDYALKLFEVNHQRFDGAWPTNVGMARGLSAVGRYDEALEYAKLAYEEAPDDLNKNGMKQAIAALEQKQDFN